MKETIEKLVCETILQEPTTITVGDKVYSIAPPVASTLIEASKYISQLPPIEQLGDTIQSALANAKDCEFSAAVVAVLMLGRKNLRTKRLFGLLPSIDNHAKLSRELLDTLTWREISELGNAILGKMDIGFFLSFTTSLIEINLLKATKTTPSGL